MKENSTEEDIKIINNFITYFNKNIQNGNKADLTVLGEEINALEHILSDYKRVLEMNEVLLKENELLRKDIEGWKKYCEEIEKDQTEMSNKNCELEFEVEKLQKENEELKLYNNSITSQLEQMTTEKFKNGWFYQSEFKDSIPIEKIKDKIEKYKKLSDKFYVKFLESDRYNTDIREKGIKCDAIILALEELIEEREEE